MSISISEPMRVALDALYEGKPAPPEVLASLTDAERAEVASLARTARVVGLSLNQPIPTAEVETSALARAHEEMAKKAVATPARPANSSGDKGSASPSGGGNDSGNWFTRLFKKPGS
ncbi:MAG: hypothetical protein H7145_12715 [Akkermansiaceae bacterium]|nr:hypothetical protein [Armatimonadota bacterium]